ncbi:hypothetical protein PT300_04660 [Enterobacteriaceae bacterium ESL0689]|nr:hypothetical protein [Enterobacteriaceae bacterium ESL0689]
MHKTQHEKAWQRGVYAATFWKKIKKIASAGDQRCVAFTKQHGLPVWVGHIPLTIILLLLFAGAVIGGMIFSSCIVIVCLLYFFGKTKTDVPLWETKDDNDDPFAERTYEQLNAIDDGAPYGESYGTWSDSD